MTAFENCAHVVGDGVRWWSVPAIGTPKEAEELSEVLKACARWERIRETLRADVTRANQLRNIIVPKIASAQSVDAAIDAAIRQVVTDAGWSCVSEELDAEHRRRFADGNAAKEER